MNAKQCYEHLAVGGRAKFHCNEVILYRGSLCIKESLLPISLRPATFSDDAFSKIQESRICIWRVVSDDRKIFGPGLAYLDSENKRHVLQNIIREPRWLGLCEFELEDGSKILVASFRIFIKGEMWMLPGEYYKEYSLTQGDWILRHPTGVVIQEVSCVTI